jgi:two-component system sensor histidine kinase SenX3
MKPGSLRAARALPGGGTGLGLAIAEWSVTIHHGTIEVVSAFGQGNTFRLRVPARAGAR